MRTAPQRFGVDTNDWLRDVPRLRAARVSFICRYHSDDEYAAQRNLTPEEARVWAREWMDIVSTWQNGRSEEVKRGYMSGVRCAQAARAQQAMCGGVGQPIFFAVDRKDVTKPQLISFFKGVKSVIGVERIGVYGSYETIEILAQARLITYAWHSYWFESARSPEDRPEPVTADFRWHPFAQLRQYDNWPADGLGATTQIDYSMAVAFDFGQWRPTFG